MILLVFSEILLDKKNFVPSSAYYKGADGIVIVFD